MIVIQGSLPIHADRREAAIAATTEMRDATLAEHGCLGYRFGFAIDDPDVVMVMEQWADEEALGAHMATPHMAAFGAAVGEIVSGPAAVMRFDVSAARPLFG